MKQSRGGTTGNSNRLGSISAGENEEAVLDIVVLDWHDESTPEWKQ